MTLEQYWTVVKKWWWLMAAAVLVAAASSYVSVSRVPRIYQATTTVMVGQSLRKANPTYQDFTISQQLAQTYVNMVQRQPILQGAADALGLSYVPWAGNISARVVPGTQLVEISVRDTSRERAIALADEIARQLIMQTPTESEGDQARFVFAEDLLEELQGRIRTTEEEIGVEQSKLDAAGSARSIQQFQSNIAALQDKLVSYQSTYASLLQTVQGGTNYISVVEPAVAPPQPISPRVVETIALASAIGLALALGGAFLIEFLDDTIRTPEDISRGLELPTLGVIARIDGDGYQDRLIAASAPLSPIAEAFRALRTSIDLSALDEPLRTLAITSPDPMAGKSVVLANLAVLMTHAGLSVIIVDADLRRPVQHKIFDLDNHRGLSNAVLQSEPSLDGYSSELSLNNLSALFSDQEDEETDEHAQPAGIGNLRIVPSGPLPPNPADFLGSRRMRELVERLKGQADVVLFDTPPILAVTDAVVLSRQVDGVLLVSDAGRTRLSAARRAVERLRQANAHVLGVVLNRVSPRRGDPYQYDYYHGQSHNGHRSGRRRGQKFSWRTPPRLALLGKLERPDNDQRARERLPIGTSGRATEREPGAGERT